MRLFRNVDEKLKDLWFRKVNENEFGVSYIKEASMAAKYNHVISIVSKLNGNHLIQSYEEKVNTDNFNNVVGLTYKETKLAMKKYRQLKRNYKWI